jgi:hypothetical protein
MVTPFGDPYSEMASSPDDCHYYELGNYITVCKPGRDLTLLRRKQTSARLMFRHGPPVDMISRCVMSSCLRVMGKGRHRRVSDVRQRSESQFVRGVPGDILKQDRSLLFTLHVALTPLASSTANPHVALGSSSPAASVVSVRVSGMVEVPCTTPFYHCC